MNILFVSPEIAPLLETSELADFTAALPTTLRTLGHDVRVILPRYQRLRDSKLPNLKPISAGFLPVGERQEQMRTYSTRLYQTPTYLLDIPAAFERDTLYGDADDDRRCILFARGVLALMLHLRDVEGWQPDVVHINGWQAALVPNYIKTYYHYTFGQVATVQSVHQLHNQGCFNSFTLYLSGLSEGGMVENRIGLRPNSFNFLARGLLFSDIISMASPAYSLEALTPEHGEGLHTLLQMRHERLAGVLYGIDYGQFNPENDPLIAAPFSADDTTGKLVCKTALQQQCGFTVEASQPLVAVVGPLTYQKGIDLIVQALPWLLKHTDAQFMIVGTGDPEFEQALHTLAGANPERVCFQTTSRLSLLQQVYAGCDAVLLPARFEPGGRSQLMALRYGCVPIVRVTGGLGDVVREGFEGNGFRFHPPSSHELIEATRRCLTSFRDTHGWQKLRRRGMCEDHSWTASAREYVGLYDWARRVVRG